MSNYTDVKEWMETFQAAKVSEELRLPDDATYNLRARLIHEELQELDDAWLDDDLVEYADAIGDLLYVVYGAAVEAGIDADVVFAEVNRSNWTKLGADGQVHLRDDGKVLKPDTFEEPQLARLLGLEETDD